MVTEKGERGLERERERGTHRGMYKENISPKLLS